MCDVSVTPWFHGYISRVTAEERLRATTPYAVGGTFLVRGSIGNVSKGWSLSLVDDQGKIIHYLIEELGQHVWIKDSPTKFNDIIDLVEYFKAHKDFLPVQLTHPCNRKYGEALEIYENVTYEHLEEATKCVLNSLNIDCLEAVNYFKGKFIAIIGNRLHELQNWFHNITCAEDAEGRLRSEGYEDGMFLVRKSKRGPEYFALVLCYNNQCHTYSIELRDQKWSVPGGRPFENLMGLVCYYRKHADGLEIKLGCCCDRGKFEYRNASTRQKSNILLRSLIQNELRSELNQYDLTKYREKRNPGVGQPIPTLSSPIREATSSPPPSSPVSPIQEATSLPSGCYETVISTNRNSNSYEVIRNLSIGAEDHLYDSARKISEIPIFDSNRLDHIQPLGGGYFGSVTECTYRFPNGEVRPVAVKTLNKEMPSTLDAFKKEADIMSKLKHIHIVELIGLCGFSRQTPCINLMIVMELAPFGQLKLFLWSNPTFDTNRILLLMWQVSEAMSYLESKEFVHRDLAARNILLKNETWAKISDFGLSRATGIGKEYYLCEKSKGDPWPIHWYAPESLEFNRFTSKGDVWSFGVTLWEALSYGRVPYYKIKEARDGQAFLKYIKGGRRLNKPDSCPDNVYELMCKCWQYESALRPRFEEISNALNEYSRFVDGIDFSTYQCTEYSCNAQKVM